ncbi:hypothetical protein WR25_12025 [Diploscapter pachys]|uniref:Uncharacterized protein n=1 Tax=Diploscapter pachys TaxID=2018661 RepID=A0A2A2KCU3_9BILA|nr:hypothetical protein WR25_12025 [Diploscapter pachys]
MLLFNLLRANIVIDLPGSGHILEFAVEQSTRVRLDQGGSTGQVDDHGRGRELGRRQNELETRHQLRGTACARNTDPFSEESSIICLL